MSPIPPEGGYPDERSDADASHPAAPDDDPPATLVPTPNATASGSGRAARYTIKVAGGGFATIRLGAKGFVIGNAKDGTPMQVRNPGEGWWLGTIGGAWKWQCGWVQAKRRSGGAKVSSRDGTACASMRVAEKRSERTLAKIASHVNCLHCAHGQFVRIAAEAGPIVECVNVFPLPDGQTNGCRTDPLVPPIAPRVKGYVVFWRYVTRDGRYVMVNDQHKLSNRGRWVFIRRSMFGDLPLTPTSQDHR